MIIDTDEEADQLFDDLPDTDTFLYDDGQSDDEQEKQDKRGKPSALSALQRRYVNPHPRLYLELPCFFCTVSSC